MNIDTDIKVYKLLLISAKLRKIFFECRVLHIQKLYRRKVINCFYVDADNKWAVSDNIVKKIYDIKKSDDYIFNLLPCMNIHMNILEKAYIITLIFEYFEKNENIIIENKNLRKIALVKSREFIDYAKEHSDVEMMIDLKKKLKKYVDKYSVKR